MKNKSIIIILSIIFAFLFLHFLWVKISDNIAENQIQTVHVLQLEKSRFNKIQKLPAELEAFETVDVFPKVEGFIDKMYVDRGSFVKRGQTMAVMIAPEMESRVAEANARVRESESQYAEANAKYIKDLGVYQKIAEAAKTPGVIARNELDIARMTMKASKEKSEAVKRSIAASKQALLTYKRLKNYLIITAPVDGVVTTRSLHPGALAGPNGAGANEPLFVVQKLSHLRLVLPVPERYYTSVKIGDEYKFSVSAYPDKKFSAKVSRPSYSMDTKYRTEYVEMDFYNQGEDFKITPGMYAQVDWIVKRDNPTFIVPSSAIAQTTERTFVIKVVNGKAKWVNIERGFSSKSSVEVFGDLDEGDQILENATDEIQNGTKIKFEE